MNKKNRLVVLFIGYTFLAFSSLTESITTKIKHPFTALYNYINRDKITSYNTIELLRENIRHHENLLKELPQSDLSSDEKITLQEKYTQEIEHLLHEIEQEKNKIQLAEYNNKNWIIKAVSLGAAIGLGTIFAYKLLTMPRLPTSINKNIHQDVPEPSMSIPNKTSQEESSFDSSFGGIHNETSNTEATNNSDVKPPSLNPLATISPTSQETALRSEQLKQKELYELRARNYTNTATIAFLNVAFGWAIWGPMHLPIDAALLALSLASGAEAWYSKQKANQLSQ